MPDSSDINDARREHISEKRQCELARLWNTSVHRELAKNPNTGDAAILELLRNRRLDAGVRNLIARRAELGTEVLESLFAAAWDTPQLRTLIADRRDLPVSVQNKLTEDNEYIRKVLAVNPYLDTGVRVKLQEVSTDAARAHQVLAPFSRDVKLRVKQEQSILEQLKVDVS